MPIMNFSGLQLKLIASARAHPPGDAVPYAFERRIMARLAVQPGFDKWALWSRSLWRAAAPCLAIMLALIAWSLFSPSSNPQTDFSQQLENAVFATTSQDSSGNSL
jgi:hypothetical protein